MCVSPKQNKEKLKKRKEKKRKERQKKKRAEMGCGSSSAAAGGDANTDVAPVAKVTPAESEYSGLTPEELQQKTHSMIRWSKPEEDLRAILACNGALNSKDPKNGNHPIHIASQKWTFRCRQSAH